MKRTITVEQNLPSLKSMSPKQFNKRVKGTEQFCSVSGVETTLALRALWLSRDDRWTRYWSTRPAYSQAT